MKKLFHSNFELDLANFSISETEENNWFTDGFFTKYSFPFEIDLVKDLDIAFGFISLYNTSPQTYFNVKYCHEDLIEDGIFEIESHQEKLSCTLRFGLEQLPSFDKLLSELPLMDFNLTLGTTIYQHANTVISATWPVVNYNFPMVHTDKYDTTQDEFLEFGKIINNRKDGLFLVNEFDYAEKISKNFNIMKPAPYLRYLLETGFAVDNLVLSGDIISDTKVQKMLIYSTVDYYTVQPKNYNSIDIQESERQAPFDPGNGNFMNYFYKNIVILDVGVFRLQGNVNLNFGAGNITNFKIKHNGVVIHNVDGPAAPFPSEVNYEIDMLIDFTTTVNNIEILSLQLTEDLIEREMCSFFINSVAYFDENGAYTPSINNVNKINLKKAVPEITFGDLIKFVKNYLNYDLTVKGNMAVMNKIENKINLIDIEDYSFSEVKTPLRKFNSGISFLLKFADVDYPLAPFLPVFQNNEAVVNANYKTDEKTNTIEINALPLPLTNRSNIETAFAFEDDNAKIYLIIYDGPTAGKNVAKPINDYLLPVIHLEYWKKWFDFRIKSIGFVWSFKSWIEKINTLKAKVKIFAYGNVHIIKNVTKTQLKEDLYEVEIETESIK